MTPQDYTNDPNQPTEGQIIEETNIRQVNQPTETERFWGIFTPWGIAVALMIIGLATMFIGIPLPPVVIFGACVFAVGIILFVLVKLGVWTVHGGQSIVHVHDR